LNTTRQLLKLTMGLTLAVQGAAKKSGPLKFFAIFSATAWEF